MALPVRKVAHDAATPVVILGEELKPAVKQNLIWQHWFSKTFAYYPAVGGFSM